MSLSMVSRMLMNTARVQNKGMWKNLVLFRTFASRNTPGAIYYTKDHEYIRIDTPNTATVGISDFAQNALGEIVFVDLPSKDATFAKRKPFGSVESVKSANDVYLPVSGTVTEVNEKLADNVQLVNEAAEGDGWMIKIAFDKPEELDEHMDVEAYKKFCDENAH